MGLGETVRGWLDPQSSGRVQSRRDGLAAAGGPVAVVPATASSAESTQPGAPDPRSLNPVVLAWLGRELPVLESEGVLTAPQVQALSHRYGVARIGAAPAPIAVDIGVPAHTSTSDSGTPGPARIAASRRAPVPSLAPFLSEHAVSIVLYLGAFLVVAAVFIFLAYAWDLVGGGAKVGIVLALTVGFLVGAVVCLPRPSVRPAGRTFLALGAILVPANVAAVYTFLLADGPLPQSLFWLAGAVLSGGLHAALSLRLASRAYGVLAAVAVPIAACALASLFGLTELWWPTAANVGLVTALVAIHRRERLALADSVRWVAVVLLPLNALFGLVALSERGPDYWSAPASLLLMVAGLGWEARRPSRTWVVGPLAGLVLTPFLLLGSAFEHDRAPYLVAVALAGWAYVGVARRLQGARAIAWDVVGVLLASFPPLITWDNDARSAIHSVSSALLLVAIARARRWPPPMLPALLFANLFYVKLLDLIGSPDSPGWLLGVALWPLALAWAAAGSFAQRRWAWPFWAAASLTSVVSAVLVQDRPHVSAGVMATFALVSVIAAWRLALPPVILLAVPWSLLAAWQLLTWFELDVAARAVGIGLVGWPFLALSLVQRLGATRQEPHGTSGPTRLVAMSSWADWSRAAAIGAAVAGACGATLAYRDADMWRIYTALAWIDLAALVAVVARLARSRDLLAGAALSLVPAMLALISFVRPSDAQAYAIPTGGYLLAVAALIRRDHRQGRGVAASLVAASGVAVLIITSVAQALDTERLGYVLWTLAEGVLLLGAGFALRWRVLVVGGVSGVVLIAVRLLFDAVSALPGWVILGGSGITLLGVAVALLLIRDRLTRTGRLVAERWASWD